jgi:hypothetical protein
MANYCRAVTKSPRGTGKHHEDEDVARVHMVASHQLDGRGLSSAGLDIARFQTMIPHWLDGRGLNLAEWRRC